MSQSLTVAIAIVFAVFLDCRRTHRSRLPRQLSPSASVAIVVAVPVAIVLEFSSLLRRWRRCRRCRCRLSCDALSSPRLRRRSCDIPVTLVTGGFGSDWLSL